MFGPISLVYWSALGCVTYTFAGYPIMITALGTLFPKTVKKRDLSPRVSVVIAAHNEGDRIGAKIENLLGLDYPKDRFELIVVSDGSDDRTDEVVESFAEQNVRLERLEKRLGKAVAVNRGVGAATGEIVVFCDARQRLDKGALKKLTACFADETVGAVSGELQMPDSEGPGLYWRYEKSIRRAESRFDSVPGATGALYAVRRELFEELPEALLLDDVYTPMKIAMKGLRVVFEPEALVYDEEPDLGGELRRKSRTLAGNYQLIAVLPELLDPRNNRIFFQFFSHKILRLGSPFALAALLGSNLMLAGIPSPKWPIYAASLAIQTGFYGAALLDWRKPNLAGRPGRAARTFVTMNLAAADGLVRFIKKDFTWTAACKTGGRG